MAYWFLWPWIEPSNLMKRCILVAWNNYLSFNRNQNWITRIRRAFDFCAIKRPTFIWHAAWRVRWNISAARSAARRQISSSSPVRFGLSNIPLKMKTKHIMWRMWRKYFSFFPQTDQSVWLQFSFTSCRIMFEHLLLLLFFSECRLLVVPENSKP